MITPVHWSSPVPHPLLSPLRSSGPSQPGDRVELSPPQRQATVDPQVVGLDLRESLSPNEVGELLSELYHLAGPKLGAKLVEPPFVLTLAQQRAETPWNGLVPNPSAEDLATFDRLNQMLKPRGYAIECNREMYLKRGVFNLVSLVGLEHVTGRTRLPAIPRFQAATGWEGQKRWKEELRSQPPPFEPEAWGHMVYGLLLGYPDRALSGYYLGPEHKERPDYNERRDLVSAHIPAAHRYECGLPEYDFSWRDINHPEIRSHAEGWNDLLSQVYASPAHRALEADPAFREARLSHLASSGSLAGRWSPELARWGVARSDRNPAASFGTAEHERVLTEQVDSLCMGLCAGLSLEAIAARLEAPAGTLIQFNEHTLHHWLGVGVDRGEGPAYRFYQVAREHRPELLDGYVAWRLERLEKDAEHPERVKFWLNDPIVRDRFSELPPEVSSRVLTRAEGLLGREETGRLMHQPALALANAR